MRPKKSFCSLAVVTIILAIASFASAQDQDKDKDAWDFPDFTATEVVRMHNADMPEKIYRSGSSVRIERTTALSILWVPANRKVYNLTTYPDNSHQCVVMKPEQAKMMPSPLELIQGISVKRTSVGTEVVEGHNSKVETVVATQPDGKTVESKVWEAEDLKGIPIKIESHMPNSTLTATYRDIVIGAPDVALFSIPEKCTPFEKMGQVVEHKILK
jgi:hypothetical protein